MMNNLQRCEKLKSDINIIVSEFILSLDIKQPDLIYHISNRKVAELEITGIGYCERDFVWMPEWNKRPSSQVVEKMESLYSKLIFDELDTKHVRVSFKQVLSMGTTTWSTPLEQYQSVNFSEDREELQKILDLQIYEHNKIYLAGENQFNCSYCRKATDDSEKVKKEIIFRTRNSYGRACVGSKIQPYCSAKCGSHDQMGHEG
jgi:hypothetical protein